MAVLNSIPVTVDSDHQTFRTRECNLSEAGSLTISKQVRGLEEMWQAPW